MKKIVRYIGLDVHKETVTIAVADSGRSQAEVVETIGNDLHCLPQVLDRLGPMHKLRVCCEAGPNGLRSGEASHRAGYPLCGSSAVAGADATRPSRQNRSS